jgi:hypothetical protein
MEPHNILNIVKGLWAVPVPPDGFTFARVYSKSLRRREVKKAK